MRQFYQCITEALMEQSAGELAKAFIPGGEFIFNVAQSARDKYQDIRQAEEMQKDMNDILNASANVTQRVIAEVITDLNVNETEKQLVSTYLGQIPATLKQSQKRPTDPQGKTLVANFSLQTAHDFIKLLPPNLPHFLAGDVLPGRSDWVLERLIGVGGFGEVWLTRNTMRKKKPPCAVKFCLQGDLLREARLVDESEHPNIVTIIETELKGKIPWLMYEYIDGGDLGDRLYQWSGLEIKIREQKVIQTLTVLSQVMGHCHQLNPPIVHRDLKPANILVDKQEQLYVTDFGIGAIAANYTLPTQMRSTVGKLQSSLYGSHTPLYASPQQQMGAPASPQDDVHALGVIGYQLLTGQMNQGASSDMAEDLEDIGVSPSVCQLLKRCTARKLERRPQDASEVLALLEQCGSVHKAKKSAVSAQPTEASRPEKSSSLFSGLFNKQPKSETHQTRQEQKTPSLPQTYTEPTTGMEFILVKGGKYPMGSESSDAYDDEKPVHWVKVNDFYMAKYPITQGQWQALMNNNPSHFKKGDDYPVEQISWEDVQAYVKKLNALGQGDYRLPTEAEWEYGARSGGKAETYAGGENLDELGWYDSNSNSTTHPVGQKKPNGLGLYDMSGNVWEWCHDWYGDYRKSVEGSPQDNPQGPQTGSNRVSRGGSWLYGARGCRTAYRLSWRPDERNHTLGARLLRLP